MPNRIFLKLCLLSGVIFAAIPAQAVITTTSNGSYRQSIAQPGIVETIPQIAAEEPASPQVTLTLEDLPPGFTELPPELGRVFKLQPQKNRGARNHGCIISSKQLNIG